MIEYLTKHNIALILNIVGAFLIAFAFGSVSVNKGSGVLESNDGRFYYFIYFLHPWWFWIGIVFMVLGFILQLNKTKK